MRRGMLSELICDAPAQIAKAMLCMACEKFKKINDFHFLPFPSRI